MLCYPLFLSQTQLEHSSLSTLAFSFSSHYVSNSYNKDGSARARQSDINSSNNAIKRRKIEAGARIMCKITH